jgi:hypothetical protein
VNDLLQKDGLCSFNNVLRTNVERSQAEMQQMRTISVTYWGSNPSRNHYYVVHTSDVVYILHKTESGTKMEQIAHADRPFWTKSDSGWNWFPAIITGYSSNSCRKPEL